MYSVKVSFSFMYYKKDQNTNNCLNFLKFKNFYLIFRVKYKNNHVYLNMHQQKYMLELKIKFLKNIYLIMSQIGRTNVYNSNNYNYIID